MLSEHSYDFWGWILFADIIPDMMCHSGDKIPVPEGLKTPHNSYFDQESGVLLYHNM